jgi:hypothetical protein
MHIAVGVSVRGLCKLGKLFKTPSKPEWCELGVAEKIAE